MFAKDIGGFPLPCSYAEDKVGHQPPAQVSYLNSGLL